ncbi:MAG: hypothetical protein V3R56_05860 [Xanthomonadales bacterium]
MLLVFTQPEIKRADMLFSIVQTQYRMDSLWQNKAEMIFTIDHAEGVGTTGLDRNRFQGQMTIIISFDQ